MVLCFSSLSAHQNLLEGLLKQMVGPMPRISDSAGIRWDLMLTLLVEEITKVNKMTSEPRRRKSLFCLPSHCRRPSWEVRV